MSLLSRRNFLGSSLVLPHLLSHAGDAEPESALRAGACVLVVRHALAPGTFDPPEFRLGDCSTQRNLSEEGRTQARRMGAWFKARSLRPARVRTSPWCRCVDTANLAFERGDVWPALGSPQGVDETANRIHQQALREALAAASKRKGGFEVWVTHMFVISELVPTSIASGEGLVLRGGAAGAPQVLARFPAV